MIDHKELQTLVAIIDGKSFDSAARYLNVSPGAISQRIKSLENRLGSSVLVREVPPSATKTGERVLAYARRMLLLHNEMNLALNQNLDTVKQSISIAVNQDSLSCWFLEVITNMSDHPNLSFEITTSDTISTQEHLKSGKVMAAITSKSNDFGGCRTRYLGQLEYLPVCSPTFYQSHFSSGINQSTLSSAPIVIYDRDDHLVEQFLAPFKVMSDGLKTHYIPSSHTLLNAVKNNIGWTLLPKLLIESALQQEDVIPLSDQTSLVKLYWNTWERTSDTISAVEKQVIAIAAKKLR